MAVSIRSKRQEAQCSISKFSHAWKKSGAPPCLLHHLAWHVTQDLQASLRCSCPGIYWDLLVCSGLCRKQCNCWWAWNNFDESYVRFPKANRQSANKTQKGLREFPIGQLWSSSIKPTLPPRIIVFHIGGFDIYSVSSCVDLSRSPNFSLTPPFLINSYVGSP